MNDAARDLVLLLQQLAERELEAEEIDAACERARRASSAVVEASLAQRVGYASYEVDWLGPEHPKTLQGLTMEESQLLPTEIVSQLDATSDEELSLLLTETGLAPEQLRAGLFAAYWILNSLEWESRDRSIPAEFPPHQRESMLAACLRSLINFRETGEP